MQEEGRRAIFPSSSGHPNLLTTGDSPPWLRRGGRDLNKISRSLLVGSGRGGSFNRPIIGGLNRHYLDAARCSRVRSAPVCASYSRFATLTRSRSPPYPRRGIAAYIPIQQEFSSDASSML